MTKDCSSVRIQGCNSQRKIGFRYRVLIVMEFYSKTQNSTSNRLKNHSGNFTFSFHGNSHSQIILLVSIIFLID